MMRHIGARELAVRLQQPDAASLQLLDVRELWEFEHCHIAGSRLMPMSSLHARLHELDPQCETVVICHHGIRSAQVCMFLQHQGFAAVLNLSGGVAAWAAEVDTAMPVY